MAVNYELVLFPLVAKQSSTKLEILAQQEFGFVVFLFVSLGIIYVVAISLVLLLFSLPRISREKKETLAKGLMVVLSVVFLAYIALFAYMALLGSGWYVL